MAVLADYECPAHGRFESLEQKCPHGCTGGVKKIFLTAPGFIGQRTKNRDLMSKDISRRTGLTDLSNKDGLSVMENYNKKYKKKDASIAMPAADNIGAAIAASGQFAGADRVPTSAMPSFNKAMLPGLRSKTNVVGRYNGE